MKFKAGDKVKIRKDLKNGYYSISNLEDYQNDKVFTIKQGIEYNKKEIVYKLLEDKITYNFIEEMLISAEEEIILKGVKKNNIYEIKLPKENDYIWCSTTNDKCFIGFRKKEILDDIEKEYLSAVIKPFRDRVRYIRKNFADDREYISINVNGEWLFFPFFKKGTMYKGMEKYKEYTLEELGL